MPQGGGGSPKRFGICPRCTVGENSVIFLNKNDKTYSYTVVFLFISFYTPSRKEKYGIMIVFGMLLIADNVFSCIL